MESITGIINKLNTMLKDMGENVGISDKNYSDFYESYDKYKRVLLQKVKAKLTIKLAIVVVMYIFLSYISAKSSLDDGIEYVSIALLSITFIVSVVYTIKLTDIDKILSENILAMSNKDDRVVKDRNRLKLRYTMHTIIVTIFLSIYFLFLILVTMADVEGQSPKGNFGLIFLFATVIAIMYSAIDIISLKEKKEKIKSVMILFNNGDTKRFEIDKHKIYLDMDRNILIRDKENNDSDKWYKSSEIKEIKTI